MSRLSRWGAGLLVAVAVASPGRAADIDPVLPAETESVMAVNLRQIVDANLIKKYALGQLKQMLQGNDVAKQLQEMGLDPLKDIDRVSVGSWGDGEDANGVAVIRGRFDLDKMFAAAEAKAKTDGDKWKIVSEGKYKLIQVKLSDDLPKPAFFTFADEKTIVGSLDKKQTVTAAETAKAGGKPQLKKELAGLVLKQDEKASMYACGLVGKDKLKLPPGVGGGIPGVDTAKLSEQLKNLKSVAFTLRLTDDVALELDAGMEDTDSADSFGATVSQLIGTAKGFLPLVAGMQPNMKPLIDELSSNLKSSVKEKDVTLTIKLSGAAIGKAAGGGD